MARKFLGEVIPNMRDIFSREVYLHDVYWTDENLTITDAILMSAMDELIYENHGSLITTKKSIYRCLSNYADISEKTAIRFFNKMTQLNYLVIIPDCNVEQQGFIRITTIDILGRMDDYIAGINDYEIQSWMIEYLQDKELRHYYKEEILNGRLQ